MKSSVLFVAPPADWPNELGAVVADDISSAQEKMQSFMPDVVVLFVATTSPQFLAWLKQLMTNAAPPQLIIVTEKLTAEIWVWLEVCQPARILLKQERTAFTAAVDEVLAHAHLQQQETARLLLFREQTTRLNQFNKELEERVEKRQRSLRKSQQKLDIANRHTEVLHAIFVAVHSSLSISELESQLRKILDKYLGVTFLQIRFPFQTSMLSQPGFYHTEPLTISGRTIAELVLKRDPEPFTEQEDEFLQEIADATVIGVDRLVKLAQAEVLKHQWQATFDAIAQPICLTDAEFRILRTNRRYRELAHQTELELVNRNCFSSFFSAEVASELMARKLPFQIKKNRWENGLPQTFEVKAQVLPAVTFDEEVRLVLFNDISLQLHAERQILESSKMAELGLIGSSIAHELNNPLGGMLSFIQLILMDLATPSPLREDILEMESATKRCSEIVQNLLGFARKSPTLEKGRYDLRLLISQALKITDLQTRSQGVTVNVSLPDQPLWIHAQENQITQALCNLVQNATEAVLEKRKADPRVPCEINIRLSHSQNQDWIEIQDSGVGMSPEVQSKIFNPLFTTKNSQLNSGLGLTIAYKIIHEHNGQLEIRSQPGVGTTARIALPHLDLHSESQVFDRKI